MSENVARLTRGWLRQAREEAHRLRLSLPQLFVIGVLRQAGRLPVTRWSEVTGSSPSTATELFDGLESAGYIARTHDRTDRRKVLVSLTGRGRRLAERLRSDSRKRWSTYCREIPSAELDAASTTLGRIVARMGARTRRGGARPRSRTLHRGLP